MSDVVIDIPGIPIQEVTEEIVRDEPEEVIVPIESVEPMGECSICIDSFTGTDHRILECKHIFHTGCINKWLEHNSTCPICRRIIPRVPISQINIQYRSYEPPCCRVCGACPMITIVGALIYLIVKTCS
jgi:hypothetical protein